MARRYCICCGAPIRKRDGVWEHVQWWRRLICARPTPLRPQLRKDNE